MSRFERRNEVSQMVQVSVEVRSGSARFWVSVRAQSVQPAASIVAGRYPGMDVKVKFPIDPKDFFVEDSFVEDSFVRMGRSALGPILGPPYTCPGGQLRFVQQCL